MSCPHCSGDDGSENVAEARNIDGRVREVLLVGTPNSGKSTLFNRLTGARQHVRNSPGTTVELASGLWRPHAGDPVPSWRVTDLPGTYSLSPISSDEVVTCQSVVTAQSEGNVMLLVADANQIHGSLYLLAQVAEHTSHLVVALTMTDVAEAAGCPVDATRLSATLGIEVVAVDPRTGLGVTALAAALDRTADSPHTIRGLPAAVTPPTFDTSATAADATTLDAQLAAADTLLSWCDQVVRDAGIGQVQGTTRSDKIDRWLLNGWFGVPFLLVVMWSLFQAATSLAAPLMDAAESLVTGPIAAAASWFLGAVGVGGGWFESFVVDGVLAGVGVVAAFAPLMAMMFLAIGLLEDSGYVARVAVLADRLMRSVGLDGRVVMPLVVGFGCNLPALSATKTLPNARQRLMVGLLIPYTSCPARLTVYVLIAGIFFPQHAGLAVMTMYLLSVLLVVGGALLLRTTAFRDLTREPLALVLSPYQRPRLRPLFTTMLVRVWGFLKGAGTIIVTVLTVVWLLLATPVTSADTFGNVPIHESAYGRITDAITPVFTPAGYGDWHMTSALLTGFVAKEVAVGALAQSYAIEEPADPAHPGTLGSRIQDTLQASSGGHAAAAAVAFMVFVLAYTPCLATVAEQRRLFGTRWTLGAVVGQLMIAWLLSVACFQLLRWMW